MSWTPHKEAEYHEVQLTRDAMSKEREDYITRITTPMRVIYNCSSDVDLLREVAKHAGTLRDLLEPFDDGLPPVPKHREECGANFRKAPSFNDGAVIRRKNKVDADAEYITGLEEKVEHLAKQLAAIAQAVKPLRDWWFSDTPSPLNASMAAMTNAYGHDVTYSQLAQIINAVPPPGSIVDTHA